MASNLPNTITELAALLRADDPPTAAALEDALWTGELEVWLETRWWPPTEVPRLTGQVRDLRQRLQGQGALARFALLHWLEPGQPLPLAEGLALHAPEELDALLQTHPQQRQALLDALQQRVEDGRLAEWLRAGEFPDTGRVLKLLDDCQRRYPDEPRLRAYAVYWFYTPTAGLPFANAEVADARELAARIAGSAAGRQAGLTLLQRGWLRTWLVATGRLANLFTLDQVLDDGRLSPEQRLELVLRLLDPNRSGPPPVHDPAALEQSGSDAAVGARPFPVRALALVALIVVVVLVVVGVGIKDIVWKKTPPSFTSSGDTIQTRAGEVKLVGTEEWATNWQNAVLFDNEIVFQTEGTALAFVDTFRMHDRDVVLISGQCTGNGPQCGEAELYRFLVLRPKQKVKVIGDSKFSDENTSGYDDKVNGKPKIEQNGENIKLYLGFSKGNRKVAELQGDNLSINYSYSSAEDSKLSPSSCDSLYSVITEECGALAANSCTSAGWRNDLNWRTVDWIDRLSNRPAFNLKAFVEMCVSACRKQPPSRSSFNQSLCFEQHRVTYAQGTANGNKISTASGVRVRTAPQAGASEVARLPIGTVVQELERSADRERIGQSEDYWYRIAAADQIQGWVFGSLIAPFDPARREEIYRKIATDRVNATETSFGDQVDLANFLKRAATEGVRPEIAAEFELGYLLALKRALDFLSYDQSRQQPYQSWLEAQAREVIYNEVAGNWLINSDRFWELHEKYRALPIGEKIAWAGASNPLPGECEGSISCSLGYINKTEGKYLSFYPNGSHAEEALTTIADFLKPDHYHQIDPEEHPDLRKETEKLRAVILKTSSARKATLLQQLDRLATGKK